METKLECIQEYKESYIVDIIGKYYESSYNNKRILLGFIKSNLLTHPDNYSYYYNGFFRLETRMDTRYIDGRRNKFCELCDYKFNRDRIYYVAYRYNSPDYKLDLCQECLLNYINQAKDIVNLIQREDKILSYWLLKESELYKIVDLDCFNNILKLCYQKDDPIFKVSNSK